MRAMILEQPLQPLRETSIALPKPSSAQVLIKVHACAICRTDLHVVDGELPNPKLPLIPGHEIVGTVVEKGKAANRFAIGDRDKLKFNSDGSLTLYIQNDSPGKDNESNWLPAPQDSFNLFMRLYWPKKEITDGSWKPPKVERAATASAKQVA